MSGYYFEFYWYLGYKPVLYIVFSIMNRNIEKEAGTKKPLETRTLSNGVIIEEIEKGKLDGKSVVKGKKVRIFDILLHLRRVLS